jgi:hypothetical protein
VSPNVQRDYDWSLRFEPEMKRILGACLIGRAPIREDREHNSDLMSFKMDRGLELKPLRIACRIRRAETYKAYRSQFTIRTVRPSGMKTEMEKILEGWGDVFFYGFADEKEEHLSLWTIADLNVFREYRPAGEQRANRDGSSEFNAYRWSEMPPSFVIANSQDWILNPNRWERFFGKVGA